MLRARTRRPPAGHRSEGEAGSLRLDCRFRVEGACAATGTTPLSRLGSRGASTPSLELRTGLGTLPVGRSGCGDAYKVRDDGEVLEVACQQHRVVNVCCRGDRQIR